MEVIFFGFQESEDDHVNFRQFVRVLAHFRPIKRTQDNKLNAREEKLRCEYLEMMGRLNNNKYVSIF